MLRVIQAPSKYIQGVNALDSIGTSIKNLGNKHFVIADNFVMKLTKNIIQKSFEKSGIICTFERFNGECSKNEVNRLLEILKTKGCSTIIGVGGGKVLDTAKAVAYYGNIPVIIVPTIASTDAPCSALSVLYTDKGVFDEYLILPQNPNMVIVDTTIISKAPIRLLVAGMGDALSTYFEARACFESHATNMSGGQPTLAAISLAKLCYDTLISEGYKAKFAVDGKVCTEAVEKIIEANTYLSGIGFESGGLAGAHAIHNGFTAVEDAHHLYHGEKVAFGTFTQLVLQNSPTKEIEEVLSFCTELGLPITLSEMGIKENIEEKVSAIAKATCAPGETIHNMPFKVNVDMVYAAIITADKMGTKYLKRQQLTT
jgi:glycerol dehydrogenase